MIATTKNLINYIKQHGHTVITNTNDTITVVEVYAHAPSEIVTIPVTYIAVREWLGY